MSSSSDTEPTALNIFLELANNILKVSGAVVLFGYISLRARMNRLGIAAPDVPADRYLMEAYNLLASVFLTAGVILLKAGIVLLVIVVILRLVRGRKGFPIGAGVSRIPDRFYLIFASAVLGFLEYWIPNTLESVPHDILVVSAGPGAFVQPVKFPVFLLIITAYGCAAGALWIIRGLPMRGFWRALRVVVLILAVIVGLQLPLLYGFAVQDYAAPATAIKAKTPPMSQRSCGLLVDAGTNVVTVWVPSQRQLLQFQRQDLEEIRLGPVIALTDMTKKPDEFEKVCANLTR